MSITRPQLLIPLILILLQLVSSGHTYQLCGLTASELDIDHDALEAMRVAVYKANEEILLSPQNFTISAIDLTALRLLQTFRYGVAEFDVSKIWQNQVMNLIQSGLLNTSACVGPPWSSDVFAMQPYLNANKLVTLSYSATHKDLSNRSLFPYFARVCPSDDLQGMAMADL
eukprot:20783-Hanusia_phi.AAC.1